MTDQSGRCIPLSRVCHHQHQIVLSVTVILTPYRFVSNCRTIVATLAAVKHIQKTGSRLLTLSGLVPGPNLAHQGRDHFALDLTLFFEPDPDTGVPRPHDLSGNLERYLQIG